MTSISEDFLKNLLEHMEDWFGDDAQFQLARLEKKYHPYTHLFSPV